MKKQLLINKQLQKSPKDSLFATNYFIKIFCDMSESLGLSKELFIKQLGLPVHLVKEDSAVIPSLYIIKGYEILLGHSKDEFLGLGRLSMPPGTLDILVRVATTTNNLREALELSSQFLKVCHSPILSKLIIEGDLIKWRFVVKTRKGKFTHLANTLAMFISSLFVGMLIKKEFTLESASFAFPAPQNVSDYPFLFGCPITFGQRYFELSFDKNLLRAPIHCNYSEVKKYTKIPLYLFTYSGSVQGVVSQVKGILAASLKDEIPSQSEVAILLRLSVRTLQRKLDAENTSYQELKDAVRLRKALFYLEHTTKSIGDIAERCGFRELTSFTRSFIRWTGKPPSQFVNRK